PRGFQRSSAENCKSRPTLSKVSRLLGFPAGFPESCPEISKAAWLFAKPEGIPKKRDGNSQKSARNYDFRLTLPEVVRLFQKSSDFFKFRTTSEEGGRKSKMRSDFEDFRAEFPNFHPAFQNAGQL